MSESSEAVTCTFFKKKPGNFRQQNTRKRQAKSDSSTEGSSADETVVVKKDRKVDSKNPMVQGTKAPRKSKIGGEVDSDDSDKEVGVSYKSNQSELSTLPSDMGATATIQTETEKDKDAQSIFERSMKVNENIKEKGDDKVYRGINNYIQYIKKKDTARGNAASGMVRQGPIRAPENVRSTVRWDYQPDLCKDYKETGYCGFGDSCKFMHDRTDYKHGWQLEMEAAGTSTDDTQYEIGSEEDKLPFKCFICRKTFKDPVVTKCKHYFCERCALANYKKSTRCYVCAQQTSGVFNPAKEIIARLAAGVVEEGEDENEGTNLCNGSDSNGDD